MSAFNMKTPGTNKASKRSHDRSEVQYNGLKNQGATCYLNAVLQCLFMTPDFREKVESHNAPDGGENLLLQLQNLFKQLPDKMATTEEITRSLDIRNIFEQQDAVEYYRKILKAVGSHVSKVFEGKMRNITKCGACGKENPETNTFISVLLPIDVGNYETYDVKKGLKTFEKHSKLEEDDWMYCDECNCKTETETWSKIDESPPVLTLHLKRFDFNYTQMRYTKNECRLDVPLHLPKQDNWPAYELYSVINHMGGYNGGHYDAIIKSYENGLWYCFDDDRVTQITEEPLKNSRLPYMLMYRKVFSPGTVPHPMRILLAGPSRAGKSTVGNIILGGNYFLCGGGSETVTKESTVHTVEKVTVVDTPNLFSLNESDWFKEIEKCVQLSEPGPNVILWVTKLSEFSEQQQGLFHAFKKRLGSVTTNHMMVFFTNGREVEKIEQNFDKFVQSNRKLRKVINSCQNKYHVIDLTDDRNYTSQLLEKLSEMVTSEDAFTLSIKKLKRCAYKKTKTAVQ